MSSGGRDRPSALGGTTTAPSLTGSRHSVSSSVVRPSVPRPTSAHELSRQGTALSRHQNYFWPPPDKPSRIFPMGSFEDMWTHGSSFFSMARDRFQFPFSPYQSYSDRTTRSTESSSSSSIQRISSHPYTQGPSHQGSQLPPHFVPYPTHSSSLRSSSSTGESSGGRACSLIMNRFLHLTWRTPDHLAADISKYHRGRNQEREWIQHLKADYKRFIPQLRARDHQHNFRIVPNRLFISLRHCSPFQGQFHLQSYYPTIRLVPWFRSYPDHYHLQPSCQNHFHSHPLDLTSVGRSFHLIRNLLRQLVSLPRKDRTTHRTSGLDPWFSLALDVWSVWRISKQKIS